MCTPHIPTTPTLGVRKNMLPSKSTKNSTPTLGVDKNMLDREILHVLKDNDLSLNIWFKRRDMDYAKGLKKKIWTHKGPSTKEKRAH